MVDVSVNGRCLEWIYLRLALIDSHTLHYSLCVLGVTGPAVDGFKITGVQSVNALPEHVSCGGVCVHAHGEAHFTRGC